MKNNNQHAPAKIGGKLRDLRKKNKLTLRQLSEAAELSIGYLSNLERDACSPTLENIQKICGILDVSLNELLEENVENRTVIRKKERKVVFEKEDAVCYESVVFGEGLMEGLCITLEPHTKYDASNWVHNYDEIGLILEGSMDIRIEKEYHHLNKGDAFYIKAKTNHSLSNDTESRCVSYWVKSPQTKG
ncbi:helix-turn-helix domain-containing protein [Eubacterium sp. 1001713B170207_170306_E7]|uniref:helix-turn-helix domain-containing protein n=1 Tax=Eubacterium sp. 1001713B170207_170306_E7 TaxID=2787097 RepID=UPI00189B238A|nr:helix-turn-helix domain-containing protein [Eubacterium sp. 1001713B170207_170306_E7]